MSDSFAEKKPRRWRKAKITLVVLAVVGVGFAGWWYAGLYSARKAWDKTCETVQAHGHPCTLEQLGVLRVVVPDEENAALVIEGISDELEDVKGSGRVMYFSEEVHKEDGPSGLFAYKGVSREALSQSIAFLEKHEDIMAELTRLDGRRTGRRVESYTAFHDTPLAMMLPNLPAYRVATKLLALQAVLAAYEGDPDKAVESNRLMYNVFGALDNEMSLIDYVLRISILALADQSLENILNAVELTPQQLEEMQRIHHDTHEQFSPLSGFRGEMVGWLQVCENLIDGTMLYADVGGSGNVSMFQRMASESLLSEEKLRKSQVIIAERFLPLLDGAEKKQWDLVRDKADGISDFESKTTLGIVSENSIPKFCLNTNFDRLIELFLRVQGAMLSAETAMATERYRLDHGRFPDSLDVLVPEYMEAIPEYPFDGKPLRYVRTDDGVVIYFVSENGVDDGGLIEGDWNEKEKRYDQPLDDGFRLLDPDKRGFRVLEGDSGE